jgi:uncharacterized protein YbjT (DUF2867 family)
MRLLVTGGSGFLGEYVLTEAPRRDHETVARARSDVAAVNVVRRGGQSLTGDLDDPARLLAAFGTPDCEALVNLASLGFGHAPAIVAATRAARPSTVRSSSPPRRCRRRFPRIRSASAWMPRSRSGIRG